MIRRLFCFFSGVLMVTAGTAGAQAAALEGYPTKPVRVIVSYSPGGATDIVARLVAARLSESLGKPFFIENITGAGGVIGDSAAARAAPDGYTVLGTSSTFSINPAVRAKLPYDALKSFAPISLVARAPFVLVVHPSLPARSVKGLIALAKAHPVKLDYASAGHGTAVHLTVEWFSSMAGIKMMHIPYKGSGPALIDLLSGQVQLTFANVLSSRAHIQAGRFRALGVSSAQRSTVLPDLPTIAESGVPGFDTGSWYGYLGPAGTPQAAIQRIHDSIVSGLKSRELREKLVSGGAEPVGSSPGEFAQFLASEIARWRKVVREANIVLK